jgi:hypothetical protein
MFLFLFYVNIVTQGDDSEYGFVFPKLTAYNSDNITHDTVKSCLKTAVLYLLCSCLFAATTPFLHHEANVLKIWNFNSKWMQRSQVRQQNFSLAAEVGGGGVGLLTKRLYIIYVWFQKLCDKNRVINVTTLFATAFIMLIKLHVKRLT